jgi:uncharacterized membrane protein YcaP (DUF421 family)
MYATALLALRVVERRTLEQWTIIDFATAVAMGAIIGRTAIAGTRSYLTGAVAFCTLILIHRMASFIRVRPLLGTRRGSLGTSGSETTNQGRCPTDPY